MNTVEFFYEFFGQHFLPRKDGESLTAHASRVLTSSHPKIDKSDSRFTNGNVAVIRESGSVLNSAFQAPIPAVEMSGTELIARTLFAWDHTEPLMLLTFEKVLFPVSNLFVTYDPRRVRVCNAKQVFDVNLITTLEADKKDNLNQWEVRLFNQFKKFRQETEDAA